MDITGDEKKGKNDAKWVQFPEIVCLGIALLSAFIMIWSIILLITNPPLCNGGTICPKPISPTNDSQRAMACIAQPLGGG